eukprot:2832902-Amphidinium_carterae.1
MITDIYSQYEKKQGPQPPWQNRFILYMIQHHATRITRIIEDAGLSEGHIKQAFDYFDEKAPRHFNRTNLRNLTDMRQHYHRKQRATTRSKTEVNERTRQDKSTSYRSYSMLS